MGRAARAFLILTGAIPLIGLLKRPPDFMLLIYTLFAAALLNRDRIEQAAARLRWPFWLRLWAFTILAGWTAECLAWGGHFLKRAPQPALLHPQLIPDLMLALGYYSGWALAWLAALRLGRFTLATVVVTTGLLGICVENMGAVLRQIIHIFPAAPIIAIMLGVFVFAVYGSIIGLAYLPISRALPERRVRFPWLVLPSVFVMMFLFSALLTAVVKTAGAALGCLPAPGPIWERPFW